MKLTVKNSTLVFAKAKAKVNVTYTDFTADDTNIIARNYAVIGTGATNTNFTSVFIKLPECEGDLKITVNMASGDTYTAILGLFSSVPSADLANGVSCSDLCLEGVPSTYGDGASLTRSNSGSQWLEVVLTGSGSKRSPAKITLAEQ